MANIVQLTADNPDALLNAGAYGTGALMRLQSGAAAAGPFTDVSGTGATPTVALVAGQTSYTGFDPSGTSSTWYRVRFENVGATRTSEWSEAFQTGRLLYAELDDLKEYLSPLPDAGKDNLLLDLLTEATGYMSALCERDFFRHPQSGTEVRTYAGTGSSRLRVRSGIISLTQVRLATGTGEAYDTLTASDYQLGPADKLDSEPYDWLLLSDASNFAAWYEGLATVELTGQFGWPSVPVMIRKATIDLAREWYRQGPGGALAAAPGQFAIYRDPRSGGPVLGTGVPPTVMAAFERYSARSVIH